MSALVIDASITLSWLLPDEAFDLAIAVRDDLPKAEAVWVPAHWRLEVCNSLWMAERRKRLDAAGVTQAAALFLQIPVTIDSETNDRAGRETLALARQHALLPLSIDNRRQALDQKRQQLATEVCSD